MSCPLNLKAGICLTNSVACEDAKKNSGNFIKSVQFSPDGSCTLSATENNDVLICSVDEKLARKHAYYQVEEFDQPMESISTSTHSSAFALQSCIPIGEAIYDLKWYPLMNAAADASSKCFITTSRDHPVLLWDANQNANESNDNDKASTSSSTSSGATAASRVRCSYRGYDQMDELDSAISLCFNLTGDRIYAGSNRMIR